jgi:hypothetical protein
MSTSPPNVRCAGGGRWQVDAATWSSGRCGWRGFRHAHGATEAERMQRMTLRPCPNCGGRVEVFRR